MIEVRTAVWFEGRLGQVIDGDERAVIVRFYDGQVSSFYYENIPPGTDALIPIDPTTGLPELERPCAECGTTGLVPNPEWETEDHATIDRLLTAKVSDHDLCGECDGRGFIVTAAGRAILTLVNRKELL